MPLYLVRHADALHGRPDAARPLSETGKADASRLGAFLAASGVFAPVQLWHSPLLRARQTAELIARELPKQPALVETAGLLPEDDPAEIAKRAAANSTSLTVALVGHEPFMSALATLLVRGKPARLIFDVRKGAVLAFERTGMHHKKTGLERWYALWQLTPDMIPARFPSA